MKKAWFIGIGLILIGFNLFAFKLPAFGALVAIFAVGFDLAFIILLLQVFVIGKK